ncbi:hypothetical protein HKX48_006933 [Thoreauomyces humboldtii]|nr:hypothetical protein HKX48_006933 [Thoreauomyces humboldtii]
MTHSRDHGEQGLTLHTGRADLDRTGDNRDLTVDFQNAVLACAADDASRAEEIFKNRIELAAARLQGALDWSGSDWKPHFAEYRHQVARISKKQASIRKALGSNINEHRTTTTAMIAELHQTRRKAQKNRKLQQKSYEALLLQQKEETDSHVAAAEREINAFSESVLKDDKLSLRVTT